MPKGTDPQPDAFEDALMQVIRARMAMRNMNIADLSRAIGIPRPTVSRIINGKRAASLNQVRLMAIATETPMSSLMRAADNLLAGKDPF